MTGLGHSNGQPHWPLYWLLKATGLPSLGQGPLVLTCHTSCLRLRPFMSGVAPRALLASGHFCCLGNWEVFVARWALEGASAKLKQPAGRGGVWGATAAPVHLLPDLQQPPVVARVSGPLAFESSRGP